MFILNRCVRESAAMTSVKHKSDWKNRTGIFIEYDICLTEKITNGVFVNSNPGLIDRKFPVALAAEDSSNSGADRAFKLDTGRKYGTVFTGCKHPE